MSTLGKPSFRKDASETMMGIFKKNEEERAALEKKAETVDNADVPKVQEEKKTEKKDEVKEKTVVEKIEDSTEVKATSPKQTKASPSVPRQEQALNNIFKKEKKPKGIIKSVYLSPDNVRYLTEQSEKFGLSFSEITNVIIDNFKANNK